MGALPVAGQITNAAGIVQSGAKTYVYERGTSTLATVYTDTALSVPATNPVVANSLGVVVFYVDDAQDLDYKVMTSDDATTLAGLQQVEAAGRNLIPLFSLGADTTLAPLADELVIVAQAILDGNFAGIISRANVEDLRSTEPSFQGQLVKTVGHTTAGVGGCIFRGETVDKSLTDDDGSIIETAEGNFWIAVDRDYLPQEFGAPVDGVNNVTPGAQSLIDSQLSDGRASFYLKFGPYQHNFETALEIDVDSSVETDFISISGVGEASYLLTKGSPNHDIFQYTKSSGTSAIGVHDLRVGVSPQENNVQSAFFRTIGTSTVLDFQFYNIYFNGIARGIQGNFVSGIFTNLLFDYMTDFAIKGTSKEFRKMEVNTNHFYKTKDNGLIVDGQLQSDGVSATTQTHRDEGQGAGHMTVTGNGFDRYFDTTVQQKFIQLNTLDNVAAVGNWFNGKTPAETNTGSHSAHYFENMDNFVCAANTAYYLDAGYYYNNCTNFSIACQSIRKGNLDASATAGAVTMIGCENFDASFNISESGGVGLYMSDCHNGTVRLVCTKAQFAGLIVSSCTDLVIYVRVLDANQVNDLNVDPSKYAAVLITGSSGNNSQRVHVVLEDVRVSNLSQGQCAHVEIGTYANDCDIQEGAVGPARTGYAQITDNGTNTRFGRIQGFAQVQEGTAVVLSGNSVVSVSLTLARALTSITKVVINPANTEAASAEWYAVRTSDTTFEIRTNSAVGSDASFTWTANQRSF